MSKKPKYPKQSATAAAAEQAQISSLNAQREMITRNMQMQDLLSPVLLEALGISTLRDSSGKVTGYAGGPNQTKQTQAQGLALDREISALKGELPIDSQLSQELDKQETALREQLMRSLGPDYAASTAGQQALADFNQRKANIVASNARSDVSALTGVVGTQQQTVDQAILTALGITQAPAQGISLFSNNAAGYGQIVGTDAQQRAARYQAKLQSNSSLFSGIGSAIGMIGGAYLGGPAGAAFGSSLGSGISSLFGGGGGSSSLALGSSAAGYTPQYGFG